MATRTLLHCTILLVFCVSLGYSAEPQPTLESPVEMRRRRAAIYEELDRNVGAVKQYFEILDQTPEDETDTRRFVDHQIQQFDDRSGVLHDELNAIERFEFLEDRKQELLEQVAQLEDDAKQLRASGHSVPAGLRQAKAKWIKRTLQDGSWRILADDEWSCETKTPDLISVLQLNAEVETLKLETAALRQEVGELRAALKKLEGMLQQPNSKQ